VKPRFLQDVTSFSLAQIISGLALMCYMLVCARLLDLGEFGLFQAIMGLYGLIIAVGSPLNLVTVHSVGGCREEERAEVQGTLLQLAGLVGVAGAGLVLLLSTVLMSTMHVDGKLPFLCVACLLLISPVLTTLYGGLQGRNLYRQFAVIKTGESVLILVLGTALMLTGMGTSGAVLGYSLAMAAAACYLILRPGFFRITRRLSSVRKELRSATRPLLVSAVLLVAINSPALIARSRLAEDASGLYGAIFSMRNLVLPFAYAVALPLYSRTINRESEPGIILKALLWVIVLALGFMGVGLACPEWFIVLLYGSKFRLASPYISWYGIYLLLHMVSMVVMFYRTARGQLELPLLAIPVACTFSLIFLPELTIAAIIHLQVLSWCAYLIALLAWILITRQVLKKPMVQRENSVIDS